MTTSTKYVDVLRSPHDALEIAARSLTAHFGDTPVDDEVASLLSMFAYTHMPRRVLEIGCGTGVLSLAIARPLAPTAGMICTTGSSERQQIAQGLLTRDPSIQCNVELRLENPLRILHENQTPFDLIVLGSEPGLSARMREALIEPAIDQLAPRGLFVMTGMLMQGAAADMLGLTFDETPDIIAQRSCNRVFAADARLAGQFVLPIGDGTGIARRTMGPLIPN